MHRLSIVAWLVLVAGCPEAPPPEATSRDQPASTTPGNDGAGCHRDLDCGLVPYVTCCGECAPSPPFEAATREELDAIFIEAEQRCAEDRRECTPPICERVPRGCYARAACNAGRCVVESEGCPLP